jgi:tetrahydromethanopterin S-methyltransferase subunit B
MLRKTILGALLLSPLTAAAQEIVAAPPEVDATFIMSAPSFFVALVSGVILAVGFQILLTSLSLAIGLNALSSATDPEPSSSSGSSETPSHPVRAISAAFGIWAIITASIGLFFACWLGVLLSMTASWVYGLVLGLTIWALFYAIMAALDAWTLSSILGSLVKAAKGGLNMVQDTASGLFSKSEERKYADAAGKVAEEVRDELFGDVDTKKLRRELERYVERLEPPKLDPRELRKEFAKMLDDVEVRALVDQEGPLLEHGEIAASIDTEESGMTREDAEKAAHSVQSALQAVKEEMRSKDRASGAIDAAMRVGGGASSDDARETRERIEQYLRETNVEALEPEAIKRDLERLFEDPSMGAQRLRERLAQLDKEDFVALLSQREEISEERARQIADYVEQAVQALVARAEEGAEGARATSEAGKIAAQVGASNAKESVLRKIRVYLNSLGRPELRYDGVKHDVELLFDDPKAGATALKRRMQAMDRETLVAILARRRDMDREDAERIVSRMEEARDDMIAKAEKMEKEVEARVAAARDEALHQADQARKAAAGAAWWAFAAAVISGGAAALGGVVGAITAF